MNNTPSTSNRLEEFEEQILPINVYLHNHIAIMLEIENTLTVTCEVVLQEILNCDELGLNNQLANQVFCLWLKSSLLGE